MYVQKSIQKCQNLTKRNTLKAKYIFKNVLKESKNL